MRRFSDVPPEQKTLKPTLKLQISTTSHTVLRFTDIKRKSQMRSLSNRVSHFSKYSPEHNTQQSHVFLRKSLSTVWDLNHVTKTVLRLHIRICDWKSQISNTLVIKFSFKINDWDLCLLGMFPRNTWDKPDQWWMKLIWESNTTLLGWRHDAERMFSFKESLWSALWA